MGSERVVLFFEKKFFSLNQSFFTESKVLFRFFGGAGCEEKRNFLLEGFEEIERVARNFAGDDGPEEFV